MQIVRVCFYLEDCGAGDCSDALHHDVEGGFQQTDVPGHQHAAGHGRVDVTSAHVADRLKPNTHIFSFALQFIICVETAIL